MSEKTLAQVLDEHRPQRLSFTAAALLVSVIGNYLFWSTNTLGVNFALFTVAFLATFTGVMWHYGHVKNKVALWLLLPILLLAVNTARFESYFVAELVPLMVGGLTIIYCAWLTLQTKMKDFDLRNVAVFRTPFLWLHFIQYVLKDLKRDSLLGDKATRGRRFNHFVFGLAIAAPLVLLFVLLFSSADPIFKQAVLDLINALDINWETFWRLVVIAFFTIMFAAMFYFTASRKHSVRQHSYLPKNFSVMIVNTILGAINLIFLFFVYIQVRYLFLGGDAIDLLDITYAEYAREGFFQLLFVVMVVGIILTIMYGTVTRTKSALLRIFASLLTIFSGIVCVSALKRMMLYQAEFGQTLLRVHVHAWIIGMMVLLLIGLVFILLRKNLRTLILVEAAVVLVLFVGMSSWNIERFIVNTNIDRSLGSEESLDTLYLTELSTDAVPTLFDRFDELSEEDRATLEEHFENRYDWHRIERRMENTDWRQATFSSMAARDAER